MNRKKLANIVLSIIIVLLVCVIGYLIFLKKSSLISQQPAPAQTPVTTQANIPATPALTPSEGYTYTVEHVAENPYDMKIVKTNNGTGTKEILLASVRTAANFTRFNETLIGFALPVNSDKIFLEQVLSDTDNKNGVIWSFDVLTKQLKKLVAVNAAFEGFGGIAVSPNKLFIAQVPEDKSGKGLSQEMKLLDLNNDSVKTILTLSGNETFNAGFFAMSSYYDIKWLDNSTIQYNVYDQSRAPIQDAALFGGKEDYKPLIGTRTVTVK